MLTTDRVYHIKGVAKELFTSSCLTPNINARPGEPHIIVTDYEMVQEIMTIIGDSGLIYLTTWDNLSELWRSFREKDDLGIAQWLLQTASTFRILGFSGESEYVEWVEHLNNAYCAHASMDIHGEGSGGSSRPKAKDLEANLALDDEYVDRLPRRTDYRALLYANPWFVYLISLQLSYHEIYADIVASQFSEDQIVSLTGKGGRTQ